MNHEDCFTTKNTKVTKSNNHFFFVFFVPFVVQNSTRDHE